MKDTMATGMNRDALYQTIFDSEKQMLENIVNSQDNHTPGRKDSVIKTGMYSTVKGFNPTPRESQKS
jgi:hypothetical protein